MKIMTVVGARPQFIKVAAVSRAFADYQDIDEVLVHTGQHFDANMSDVFFSELGLPYPDHSLEVQGGGHSDMTGRMLQRLEPVMQAEAPDWVLVYGDTNSTLAAALCAAKLSIPVAHVEAGLRSFNRRMPEEINRVLTDQLSRLLFCPTEAAVHHLASEGIRSGVELVGDVMYDSTLYFADLARECSHILPRLGLTDQGYVLATLHRQENVDDPVRLAAILAGLAEAPLPVVLPLHPRTRQRLMAFGLALSHRIQVIDPVGYLDMTRLEMGAALIATDSGGVQKEAFFHRVPCLTLRDETEWVELVEMGCNRLVGADTNCLVAAWHTPPSMPASAISPYGKGDAAKRIVDRLIQAR